MNDEGDWNECIENNSSLTVSPDHAKARSLIDTAKGRVLFLERCTLDPMSCNYLFEGYYSSILELLHARLLQDGFKVLNHICLGYYLRDVMGDSGLYRIFDDCRYKRNSLVYYGRKMDFEVARDAIKNGKKLFAHLCAY